VEWAHRLAEATVTVPSTGEAAVELRLQAGARVRFVTDANLPAGRYQIEIMEAGSEFRVVHVEDLAQPGPLEVDRWLPPGSFEWRLAGRTSARPGEAPVTPWPS
jgi:hypothetical protein